LSLSADTNCSIGGSRLGLSGNTGTGVASVSARGAVREAVK
jgi:hypothetical protein